MKKKKYTVNGEEMTAKQIAKRLRLRSKEKDELLNEVFLLAEHGHQPIQEILKNNKDEPIVIKLKDINGRLNNLIYIAQQIIGYDRYHAESLANMLDNF